jgi:hypothetical protein
MTANGDRKARQAHQFVFDLSHIALEHEEALCTLNA